MNSLTKGIKDGHVIDGEDNVIPAGGSESTRALRACQQGARAERALERG